MKKGIIIIIVNIREEALKVIKLQLIGYIDNDLY